MILQSSNKHIVRPAFGTLTCPAPEITVFRGTNHTKVSQAQRPAMKKVIASLGQIGGNPR
jgi:hypothetical protein